MAYQKEANDGTQAPKELSTQLIGFPVNGHDDFERKLIGYFCIRNFLVETEQGEGIYEERKRLAREYPDYDFIVHLHREEGGEFRRIWAKKN